MFEDAAIQNFLARVRFTTWDGCWEWAGCRQRGYGVLRLAGFNKAHCFAYTMWVGRIPTDLTIDHLCRNRGCVNPRHLEPVTAAENTRRALVREVCKAGIHSLTGNNVKVRSNGERSCRECERAAGKAYSKTHRAQMNQRLAERRARKKLAAG